MSETTPEQPAPQAGQDEESSALATLIVVALTLGMIGAFLFAIGIFALPGLVHAMDRGQATADAGELSAAFSAASRNLTVKGVPRLDLNVGRTVRQRGTAGTTSVYFPLVPASWTPGQPVKVIASAREFKSDQLDALAGAAEFKGVLANAPLESIVFGIPGSVRTYLQDNHKLKVADDAVLFNLTPPGK